MRELDINRHGSSFLPQMGILTNIVELSYYEMIYIHRQLQEKDQLELRREFNPIFDKYAIEVYYQNKKLGYISNKVNHLIAKHMDMGKHVFAQIKHIHRNRKMPLKDLEIQVIIM